MLAYAPRREMQPVRPGLFALIALGHVAVIGGVMATKMVIDRQHQQPTDIDWIPETKPPEPELPKVEPRATPEPNNPTIVPQPPIVDVPMPPQPSFQDPPTPPSNGPSISAGAGSGTAVAPPQPPPVRKGPRLATAEEYLRPPYPESMESSEKEAVIALTLSIDERGRVVAVAPIGAVEPAFLDAARAHILKRWRYQPATENGRPVPSTLKVRLKFEISDG